LRQGRTFNNQDRAGAPSVAVINEVFARRYFPSENPIGARLSLSRKAPPLEIVGVVANANQQRLDLQAEPALFVPYAQQPRASLTLVIRATGDAPSLIQAVRREVSAVARNQPLAYVTTMEDLMEQSLAPRRYPALLLSVFAAIALV